MWGLRLFGAMRPVRAGGPFRGGLARHRHLGVLAGHGRSFRQATTGRGEDASAYFSRAGISAFARAHSGICAFRLGRDLAVYQITNDPLVDDEQLAPSTATNRELFGTFMGSLAADHPERPAKRAVVERTLGSAKFIRGIESAARRSASEFLHTVAGKPLDLNEFGLSLVAHVDSYLPGVLDLAQQPLTWYLDSPEYGDVVRSFFEVASDVIMNVNKDAMKRFNMIVPFVRDVICVNLDSIAAAPASNLIRRQLALWDLPVTRAAVDKLSAAQFKEIGTIIVATYDTTALSLVWALAYLETSPEQKAKVVAAATGDTTKALSAVELAVLEAVRLGGSNPTALWRRTTAPVMVRRHGLPVRVPAGTMMWLDRRQANQDPAIFPNPGCFDLGNIQAIVRSERETISSVLSRNRYEINSFNMINTNKNPRKCPGRLFSVQLQSILLSEIYGRYRVQAEGIDTSLRIRSSMPRPACAGTIRIEPR
jgi:cytochrome P450